MVGVFVAWRAMVAAGGEAVIAQQMNKNLEAFSDALFQASNDFAPSVWTALEIALGVTICSVLYAFRREFARLLP